MGQAQGDSLSSKRVLFLSTQWVYFPRGRRPLNQLGTMGRQGSDALPMWVPMAVLSQPQVQVPIVLRS